MFPPFSLVGQVLTKIYRDKTNAVIIAPDVLVLVPTVATDDQPGPTVFSAVTKKLEFPNKLSVNHNIAEKIYNYLLDYQYIANLIIKLNN